MKFFMLTLLFLFSSLGLKANSCADRLQKQIKYDYNDGFLKILNLVGPIYSNQNEITYKVGFAIEYAYAPEGGEQERENLFIQANCSKVGSIDEIIDTNGDGIFNLSDTSANTDFERHPEVLVCSSIAPFTVYQFYPKTGQLKKYVQQLEVTERSIVSNNSVFRSVGEVKNDGSIGSSYKVFDFKTNKTLIELKLTNKGTDSFTDRKFPFEAIINNDVFGCESTSTPSLDVSQTISKLKNQ